MDLFKEKKTDKLILNVAPPCNKADFNSRNHFVTVLHFCNVGDWSRLFTSDTQIFVGIKVQLLQELNEACI